VKLCRKSTLFWGIFLPCAVLLFVTVAGIRPAETTAKAADTRPLILLDAGHGGEDGGALAPDQTTEKELNLDITLTLSDMLTFCGYRTQLTRDSDQSLGSGDTVRARKVSDMNARLALYNSADLVVSVHQNKFGNTACNGAQFFYSQNTPESRALAQCLRRQFTTLLQPNNERELKAGGDNVFLLYKTTTPAVLAECGFLSNPDELAALKDETYRQSVAFALLCGIVDYNS